ncbi:hypothetical protein RJ640_027709 [Escallonia rubra]|uniref:Uncharacterized protein n=1 Tax=Escallonia rubra TaxID=112253 RepID=A0AA88U2D5_9ASTE|nr:hypothetical protein RJ640_027709 [Escallonia rubra]
MSITSTTRRPKWHPTPPPPPTPKILNLPRRTRRKQPKSRRVRPPIVSSANDRGKLESLFDQERVFTKEIPVVLLNSSERRERVEEEEESGGGGGFVEEKWRFQAEILRAECNFLRMERELALKKLERNRIQIERTLQSAVETLGRERIYEEKNVSVVLQEEIGDLAEKLEELQRSSGVGDSEVRNCSNFDKKASLLQRRLEKLGGLSEGKCMKEVRGMAEASFSIKRDCEIDKESLVSGCRSDKSTDVERLRKKLEELPKGMLDRMEEYGSMLSTTATSSVTSSASTSKHIEFPDSASFSTRQPHQACILNSTIESTPHEENLCSGRCKAVVRRIVAQVRAETEQWSQMQEMLGQVRKEMEELQASRDLWKDRALDSENKIQSLQSSVQEWREKALTFETKANELQTETSTIRGELEKLKIEEKREVMSTQEFTPISLSKQIEMEKRMLKCRAKEYRSTADRRTKQEIFKEKLRTVEISESMPTIDLPPISLGKHIAKEKHGLLCRLKEDRHTTDKGSKKEKSCDGRRRAHTCSSGHVVSTRSPFRDIGNSSPLVRQSGSTVFPLHSPEPLRVEESF